MEVESPNHQEKSRGWFKSLSEKLWSKMDDFVRRLIKLGKDDPKKIVHAIKVGLTITFVSIFYYFDPLFDGFGVSAMWAVLTVVVVFEYSVGATLGKGLNRMLATMVAGALGIGAHRIATLSGHTGEPILISVFNLIVAATVTFVRFLPKMKARYDYGLMMFILTFCLVSVSGYRDDEVIHMAIKRLTTVIIGSCASVIMCICIWPAWIGVDLHNQIATNLEKLGNFLEGYADEYFKVSVDDQDGRSKDKSFLEGYKSILTSKNSEETMANLARWEPRHGRFRYRHPWKQYLKVGTLARECAYKIEALHSYLRSEIQTPPEVRNRIVEPCTMISKESSKALKELATTIRKMTRSSIPDIHVANSKAAAENLKSILKSGLSKDVDLLLVVPAAATASLLLEIVTCTEKIAEAVHELESRARFKRAKPRVIPDHQDDSSHHQLDQQGITNGSHDHHDDYVITIDGNGYSSNQVVPASRNHV
ncbi:aluminum-activated malate transporter 2 [Ziziphus jujuba]|uniref:Aluminum-activated malate transporter 2 n=1 Tax=Ziziphus jujuba TaxID=326968 RepID=A0ABM3IA27_ZIZJJ|nr:aluminum-activated malate transporter 2 [Ziziphus jujuba]